MIKLTHFILAGAVVSSLCSRSFAQDARPSSPAGTSEATAARLADAITQDGVPEPLPGAPDAGVGSGVLEALPRPRAVPESLFAPADPPSPGGIPVARPYFIADPLLDLAPGAPPGWFIGAEAQIVKPHLITRMANSVFPGKLTFDRAGTFSAGGNSTVVNLPSANLDWTAAPRVFAGYRLPAGFGEFMVAYRHLGTSGSGSVPDTNGPLSLNTRFAQDIIDFDYNSRELSLWPLWDMRWTFGLRTVFLFWESQANQPFSQASASNGIILARASNNFFGLGPHAALELNRHLADSGFSFTCRGDFAGTFDYVNEVWQTASTTRGPSGRPLFGETRAFGHQAAPMITGRVGLSWQPSPTSGTRLFIGYQYDVMWNLNRLLQSNGTGFSPPSLGQFWDQGIVLQATIRF
jgi:hypothetical protein